MTGRQLTRHIRRGARRAFTLVELMLAVLISAIVLLSVYFVFVSTAEQFYRQEQVVQMQDGMRFALEYLKNDLRNAGRLALVNGAEISTGLCDPVTDGNGLTVNAVRLFEGGNTNQTLQANNLSPDRLRLLVDGSGGIEFTSVPVPLGSSQIVINRADLQRTVDARKVLSTESRFTSVFKPGLFLHVASLASNKFDLVPIDEVAFAAGQPIITLTEAICMECSGGCVVNPVQYVEYRIEGDSTVGVVAAASLKTDLVRALVDARDGSQLGVSLRMAEYAIDLQVWGTYDSRASAGAAPTVIADPNPVDALGNWPNTVSEETELNKRPERIRGLNVLLATRTPREDESHLLSLQFAGRPADLTWFELDNQVPGFARVATLRAEVETPNLNRGL